MSYLPALRNGSTDTANELTQLVSFHLDNEEYGVEVLKVREIIGWLTLPACRIPRHT